MTETGKELEMAEMETVLNGDCLWSFRNEKKYKDTGSCVVCCDVYSSLQYNGLFSYHDDCIRYQIR